MRSFESHSTERVKEAVRSFVRNRRTDFPISIADLSRKIRYVFPDIAGSERELADLLAREIVRAGGNVTFDGNLDQLPLPTTIVESELAK